MSEDGPQGTKTGRDVEDLVCAGCGRPIPACDADTDPAWIDECSECAERMHERTTIPSAPKSMRPEEPAAVGAATAAPNPTRVE